MQFVSLKFLIFLFLTISIYFIVPKKIRYVWLLLTSWCFYYLLSGKLLLLLIAVTVVTYFTGIQIDKCSQKDKMALKKASFITGIVLLVIILGYFKYTGFMVETVRKIQAVLGLEQIGALAGIVLPVGISFYIFQAIGYMADCYNKKISVEKNYLRLALFISFFPQIMSGPIERAGKMIPQFMEPKDFSYDRMRDGLLLMLWGYFQKIIIADRLAVMVNHVYSSYENYSGTIVFLTTVFYTFEIYCDFAGYSNIAIGCAKIMGIDIMKNFEQPYLSGSIAEFWRRWHMSLSSWLRDYLYIPLGGNRKGYVRKLINICIVFAISGLWHGAAWTFVIWGLLHGMYQVIGIVLKPVRDAVVEKIRIDRNSFSHNFFKIVVTFMLVNIGWIFFRATTFNSAVYMLKNMWKPTLWTLFDGSLFNLGLSAADVRLVVAALGLMTVIDILNKKGIVVRNLIYRQSLWFRWAIYIAAVVFIVTLGVWGPGYDAASFIYSSF
ncbi:MBOAT family O-acyltransferase [Butyrivibrio sp. YAB3001]|uniref:MBOAT family O-acyltransferase n=1 Tax=Butyrivibrio sp. YAB3001 TaxID=1520812 RepID=UPI0008F64EB2|nr:MBOAT family O-acyltransferase [Butyrivibrio sp. YAB3001]SFB72534.1 D-alanyl-lipoteichoic acid acyltransferase DltB, MBOAT superfamily [Butyrivibrio sp. YAB3001]